MMSYFIFAKYLNQSEREKHCIALKIISPCYPEGGGAVDLKRWRDRQVSYDYSRYLSKNTYCNGRICEAWIKSYDHKAIYLGHVAGELCKLVLITLKEYVLNWNKKIVTRINLILL